MRREGAQFGRAVNHQQRAQMARGDAAHEAGAAELSWANGIEWKMRLPDCPRLRLREQGARQGRSYSLEVEDCPVDHGEQCAILVGPAAM